MSIFKELNDKEWLIQKYEIEKLSTKEIGKILNCNCNSVRQALIKHSIEVRSQSFSQRHKRQDSIIIIPDVLDGSLLGDAGLRKWKKDSANGQALLYKKNKHKDHLEWFALHFEESFNIQQVEHFLKATGKTYEYYHYRTKTFPELSCYFDRWYPESNNFKKIIPDDICISETMLLHWFLDDGFSHFRDRGRDYKGTSWSQKKEQVVVKFCTDCFSLDDQERLCEQLNNKFALNFKVVKYMKYHRIGIPQSKSNDFFEIIGQPPVESLAYKWKIVK